jgi:hypothetical protein
LGNCTFTISQIFISKQGVTMVTITRSLARLLRAVLRKAGLGKSGPQPDAFVYVSADNEGQRLRVAGPEVVVEYRQSGEFASAEFVLPVEVLATIEGRTQEPVVLEPAEPGRIAISFSERGVPQLLDRNIDRTLKQPTWPELPTTYAENSADLWPALRDAVATTDREPTRYALNCLQLRGRGDIAATDGHHILIQAGFTFPWTDNLLVPARPLLGCKELDTGEPVRVGIAGDWVTLGIGPWLISLKINREARFPNIDDCLPQNETAKSHLTISPTDAEFLRHSLPGLPCNDPQYEPVTLDLNGRVIVRGQGEKNARTSELLLSNSRFTGDAIRLSSNRRYLARAINMGFREVHLNSAESPVLCQDERRRYVWALLGKEGVIEPSDDAIVTASPLASQTAPIPVPRVKTVNDTTSRPVPAKSSVRRILPAKPGKLSMPLDQAIALRDSLRNAASAAQQLVRSLKQQKRESRIVATTLASLKQLQKVAS